MQQTLAPQPIINPTEIEAGVRSLRERGFYVVERSLSETEAAENARIMDELIANGVGGRIDNFGHHLGKPCASDTRLCDMYAEPRVVAIVEALFGDEARLKDSGARISDRSDGARINWHTHPYAKEEEPTEENPLRYGKPITHLVCAWYMEGCSAETGPLIALPRRYDELVNRPLGDLYEAWPGEVVVDCPPGSCVLFSTDLWHSAMAGTSEQRRHLCGGHYQAADDPRPHREDGVFEGPAIEAAVERNPTFARLIGR